MVSFLPVVGFCLNLILRIPLLVKSDFSFYYDYFIFAGISIGIGVVCGFIALIVRYVGIFLQGFTLGGLLALTGKVRLSLLFYFFIMKYRAAALPAFNMNSEFSNM